MITAHVGLGSCGISSGALDVYNELKKEKSISVKKAGCMGACFLEPIVEVKVDSFETIIFANVKASDSKRIIETAKSVEEHKEKGARFIHAKRRGGEKIFPGIAYIEDSEFFRKQNKIVSARCGIIDPENIDEYIAAGGFAGLKKALTMSPIQIVSEVKKSGLRGRGGSGFPAGIKWEMMLSAPEREHYLICNFDEGDPGAFMNRALVESDPFQVVEGVEIAAYALNASTAFIYTRAEYPLAVERLKNAIKEAEKANYLGNRIFGSEFSLNIEIRLGAGAFICGEETALIKSIEGNAGRPMPRPPYPAERGLWKKPTVVNNVETLSNIPKIILNGADWFKKSGTALSPGTKMFSISGDVKNSGYAELAFGLKISDVMEMAGIKKSEFKAVQIGGPSGGLVGKENFSMQIDYESVKSADAIVGSGGLVFIGKDKSIIDAINYGLKFIVSESCGRCVPCREGTMRMYEITKRIAEGNGTPQDVLNLHVLSNTIKATALCGLGETAPNLVLSSIRNFFSEYEERISLWKGKAPNLMSYSINPAKCNGCHLCATICPKKAISGKNSEVHEINSSVCIKCALCYHECPFSAIEERLAENDKNLKIKRKQ
jgi:NADH:ubiquinone oxidoreductase subunit F (NADH-binding)/NAD-dependent dihydropyrimidine dehydrogenase PreA subunit/(2Fe-2S) ferredoxin